MKKKYLLNEKAFDLATGKPAKDLFKDKALKQYGLSDQELKQINPVQTDDSKKAKVFMFNSLGISRVVINDGKVQVSTSTYISEKSREIGKKEAGY